MAARTGAAVLLRQYSIAGRKGKQASSAAQRKKVKARRTEVPAVASAERLSQPLPAGWNGSSAATPMKVSTW